MLQIPRPRCYCYGVGYGEYQRGFDLESHQQADSVSDIISPEFRVGPKGET